MRIILVLLLVFHIAACRNTYTVTAVRSSIHIEKELLIDSKTDSIASAYREKMSSKLSEKIGFAPEALEKGKPEGKLGNLLADFTLNFARKSIKDKEIFCALLNNGGIRTSLPRGDISINDIYELMPFDNRLILVELNENQWNKLLQYLKEKEGQPIAGFTVNISNLSWNSIKKPNFPIWVATSDYLAQGGDGMSFLNENNIKIETPYLLRDVFIDEMKFLFRNNLPISAKIEGRIVK